MIGILQLFFSALSGVLTALSISNELLPYGNPLAAFFALVPFYIALRNCRSFRQAALCAFIQAGVTHLLSCYWLSYFRDFAVLTLGASACGTGGILALFSMFLYLPYSKNRSSRKSDGFLTENSLVKAFYSESGFRIFYFAAVYVLYEWFKSSGFLAFPWGTLSMGCFSLKYLIQSADIFGTYGITFLAASVSALTGEFLLSRQYHFFEREKPGLKGSLIVIITCILSLNVYGIRQYNQKLVPEKILNCSLIQQNKDPWIRGGDTASILTSMELTEKAIADFNSQGKSPDLVVWSEGILRNIMPLSYVYYTMMPEEQPLVQFIINHQVPFLIGGAYALDAPSRSFANAALMFDRNGNFTGWYGKRHLVPLAESVPFIEYPAVKKLLTKITGFSFCWTPGQFVSLFNLPCRYTGDALTQDHYIFDQSQERPPYSYILDNEKLLENPSVLAASPICFEDAFPDIFRDFHRHGAELFVNITDDSWSLTKSAEYQHFVIACFRAIEFRTTLVRSTNSGVTAVIDPAGRILCKAPLFEKTYLNAEVPVYRTKHTVYSSFLNWFNWLLMILTGLFVLYCMKDERDAKPPLKVLIEEQLLLLEKIW